MFSYLASEYVCNVSHDIYDASYETTFFSMSPNCINDLKLVSALLEISRLAFNSLQQNWYVPSWFRDQVKAHRDSSLPMGGNIVTWSHQGTA